MPKTIRFHTLSAIALITLLSAPPLLAQEMTVERLLAANLEARGGAEAWKNLKTLKLVGTYNAFSTDSPMTILRQAPNLFRFDTVLFDAPTTMAFDGKTAWFQSVAIGAEKPTSIDGVWGRNLRLDSPFGSLLQAYAADGAKIDLLGKQKVEGETLWALRVEVEGTPTEHFYLDLETFLEVKRTAKTYDVFSGPEFESDMEVFYMDYRNVGGVKIPFREERHYGIRYNVYVVEEVEANAVIDPAEFRAGG